MQSRFFIEEEILLIEKEYKKKYPNLIRLSKKIGRRKSSICRKAKEIGIKTSQKRKRNPVIVRKTLRKRGVNYWVEGRVEWLKRYYNNLTNKELAGMLGVHEATIEKKLKELDLKKDLKKRGWIFRNGHPKGMSGKTHSEENKKIFSEKSKEMWRNPDCYLNSDEYRQIMSDRAVKLQKEKVFRNRYSRGRQGKRKDLGIYVRSSWEANYARYLNWMKKRGEIKDWKYEIDTFDFPVKRGTRFYTPDFKIWENDGSIIYHEVKGWMTQKGQTALNRMAKYYPEIKIVLIDKAYYKSISQIKRLIPNWE